MTRRRAKGEGSVYRCKDGRCIGEYEDAYGKRRYISGKTRVEVRAKLRKLLSDQDEGIAFDSKNLTIGTYLESWLDSIRATVRESTWERYEVLTRSHIVPVLGRVKLDKLNALQVQGLYRAKLDEGLSTGTVRLLHVGLLSALKQAVKWELIRFNVCASVTPPRRQKPEIKPLTAEQVKALRDAISAVCPCMHNGYASSGASGPARGLCGFRHWSGLTARSGRARLVPPRRHIHSAAYGCLGWLYLPYRSTKRSRTVVRGSFRTKWASRWTGTV
jgi:integrase